MIHLSPNLRRVSLIFQRYNLTWLLHHVSFYIFPRNDFLGDMITRKTKKKFIINSHARRLNVVFFWLGRCYISNVSARNKYIKKMHSPSLPFYPFRLFFSPSPFPYLISPSSFLTPLYRKMYPYITVSPALKHPTCPSGLKSLSGSNVSSRLGLENA